MSRSLPGSCAIVGIGQTEFSKESGRSELQLACEAVSAAIDDAGLAPGDVDGMVTFTMDASDEIDVARNVGIGDLTFFSRVPPRRRGGGRHRGARGHGRRDRRRRRGGVLARLQRAFRHALRRQRTHQRRNPAVHGALRAVRIAHSRSVGRAARPALHVDLRSDQRGLRPDRRRRPRTRGQAIPTPGSTSARSRWRTTRIPAGSSNPCCDCWIAARKATAGSRWW